MKTKIIILLLCLTSLNAMGQNTVTRKKTTATKTEQKQTSKPQPKPQPKANTTPKAKSAQTPKPDTEAAGYDVTFSCNVSSALLYIDGNANGSASGTRFLKTGNHSIKVSASGYEDYSGNFSVNSQNTSCSITLQKTPEPIIPTAGTVNGHEWVDLGLSVKWATCNVGASTPGDYGGYYAWGETTTKSSYDESNCFDCINPKKFDKNTSWGIYRSDGQTRIAPTSGHDTARENWGGTWRMPTDAENKELCEKCKWTWTTKNGHNGYTVTGPNGNSIFLPAAGYRFGTSTKDVGESGEYWSSTLHTSSSFVARYLKFNDNYYTYFHGRMYGRSVRPVTDK